MKTLIFISISFLYLFCSEPIKPIPKKINFNPKKAYIGKKLFFDTSLSKDGTVACINCHNIYSGGADPNVVSIGVYGKKGVIQAPSVLNAVFNFRQFWNGRAKDLYEQAKGPLLNPVEHGMSKKEIEIVVNNNKEYKKLFKKNYITFEDVIDAIVEYEKTLITPNSKFDLFLKGEKQLSKKEFKGYLLFKHYGCISCHNGINVGGNSFQKMGAFAKYDSTTRYPDRYEVTKNINDKHVYKVPTLRNIALTAPYFHDGSAKTLKEAIQTMASYNLGIEIEDSEIELIEAFLETLTGELPKYAR